MHDLPSQTLLQQAHARSVSGEELEMFGKKAASLYTCGGISTLNEAVVETVKHAGLSPEQVRRVVEFTNQTAYLHEFQKEGSPHKYIEFHGGPANPAEVIKDLNDGGGGTVFDRGAVDYASPPPTEKVATIHARNRAALGLEKVAAVVETRPDPAELAFEQMFRVNEEVIPYAEPLQDSIAMRDKLAAAMDGFGADLNALEGEYAIACDQLYSLVKQASLEGTPLGHILQAWRDVTPGEGYVKAAFSLIGPRLIQEGVFEGLDAVGASIEKIAGEHVMVNQAHPIVGTFAAFCTTLDKLASTRAAQEEVVDYHNRLTWFLKQAAPEAGVLAKLRSEGGLLPKVWGGAKQLAESAAKPVGAAAGLLHPALQGPAETVVRHLPHAAAALGAKEVYDRGIKYGPGQLPLRYAKSHIPGTREYYVRQYNLQQGLIPM
jgi:hypothetical protein